MSAFSKVPILMLGVILLTSACTSSGTSPDGEKTASGVVINEDTKLAPEEFVDLPEDAIAQDITATEGKPDSTGSKDSKEDPTSEEENATEEYVLTPEEEAKLAEQQALAEAAATQTAHYAIVDKSGTNVDVLVYDPQGYPGPVGVGKLGETPPPVYIETVKQQLMVELSAFSPVATNINQDSGVGFIIMYEIPSGGETKTFMGSFLLYKNDKFVTGSITSPQKEAPTYISTINP